MQPVPRLSVNLPVMSAKTLVNLLVKPTKSGQGGPWGGLTPILEPPRGCILAQIGVSSTMDWSPRVDETTETMRLLPGISLESARNTTGNIARIYQDFSRNIARIDLGVLLGIYQSYIVDRLLPIFRTFLGGIYYFSCCYSNDYMFFFQIVSSGGISQ